MQTHCFVHINSGIWSLLQEDPISHQEYVQRCNLHLLYLRSNVYAELEAHTEIIQYKIFGEAEPLPIEVNVNEPAVGTLSPSELNTLNNLIEANTHSDCQELTSLIKPSTSSVTENTQAGSTTTTKVHRAVTTTTATNVHSAGTTTIAINVPIIDAMDQPVPSTSSASGTAQTGIIITAEVHSTGTTKMDTEGWPSADILDHTTDTIDNTDHQDTSMSLDLKTVPGLTSNEITKIVKRQPRKFLTSSTVKPNKPDTRTVATDQCKNKLNSQSKVTPTNTDKKQKAIKRGVKRRSTADVVPSKDSANCFKYQISQHILKRKYKCKYYFKCAVQDCDWKLKSVSEWNKHHKTKHSDVKYVCSTCNKMLHTPCSVKDHKYTHNHRPHICGRCNQGFLSPGHLNQHKHIHHRQCLYSCFAADCTNTYKWPQDLLRHVKNHTAPVLKCKLCTYSSTEHRLIKQHQNVHSDVKKFKCRKCTETFQHSMQRYHHKKDKHLVS